MKREQTISDGVVLWLNKGWQTAEIGFSPSSRAFRREMRLLGHPTYPAPTTDAATTALDDKCGCRHVIVSLRGGIEKRANRFEIAGLLAHEATHVWQWVRQNMGETAPGMEIEAYAIQAIFQQLYRAWWDTRGKRAQLIPD